MESDVRFAQDLLTVMDKLIIAVVAIVASVVAQYLTHRFSKEREREKILIEKAEQLARVIYRHQEWMEKRHRHHMFDAPDITDTDPLHEIMVLCHLYFPSLAEEMRKLLESVRRLLEVGYEQEKQRKTDPFKWAAEFKAEGFIEDFWEPYQASCRQLLHAIAMKMPHI